MYESNTRKEGKFTESERIGSFSYRVIRCSKDNIYKNPTNISMVEQSMDDTTSNTDSILHCIGQHLIGRDYRTS